MSDLTLNVHGFEAGEKIPAVFACDGDDISPQLSWKGIPEETMSLAVLMYDPDAPRGTFNHWILYNIPPSITTIDENVPSGEKVEGTGTHGKNDFGNTEYGGPCPPAGKEHRYFFELVCLKSNEKIKAGLSREEFEREIEGNVIQRVTYMGVYERKK